MIYQLLLDLNLLKNKIFQLLFLKVYILLDLESILKALILEQHYLKLMEILG